MKTRIYVNRRIIARNKSDKTRLPPLVIHTSNGTRRAWKVHIRGPSQLIYAPDKPLKSGASIWIETDAEVN